MGPLWFDPGSCLLMMGPIGSSETSVFNKLTLRNNPEDGRIHFNRGGSLRSRIFRINVECLTLDIW